MRSQGQTEATRELIKLSSVFTADADRGNVRTALGAHDPLESQLLITARLLMWRGTTLLHGYETSLQLVVFGRTVALF